MKTQRVYIAIAIIIILFISAWYLWGRGPEMNSGQNAVIPGDDVNVDTNNPNGTPATTNNINTKPTTASKPAPSTPQPGVSLPTYDKLDGVIWKMTFYNGMDISKDAKYSVTFSGGSLSARICNSISGEYVLDLGKIKANNLITTKMYCSSPAQIMDIETTFISMLNNGATISYVDNTLTISDAKNIMRFTDL